jgi:uncharacterized OB-fold protein
MTNDLPAPLVSPDGAPYWRAAAEERLELQCCADCGTYRFPPSHLCRQCGSDAADWREVSGNGTIYSFTIVHRAPTPEFRAHVPYVVALIDLAEGPRMMANIIGPGALECAIGDAVAVTFEARGPDAKVPQFRLAET